MAVSLAFMIKAVFFWDTKLLELRWALLPQSDNNWISTHQPTSQSSSLAFHYAPVILTISWPLEHSLHSKICCPFETLHLFLLQLDISTQIFNISVTWRINRAKRSASNVAHYMATNLVLAISRGTYFLLTGASPQCCLSVLKTWRLASLRVSHPKERATQKLCLSWPNLGGPITATTFYILDMIIYTISH